VRQNGGDSRKPQQESVHEPISKNTKLAETKRKAMFFMKKAIT